MEIKTEKYKKNEKEVNVNIINNISEEVVVLDGIIIGTIRGIK